MIAESAVMVQPQLSLQTVWGLSAAELHVAFWRSKGVQVIERGRHESLQRDAELYLLTEPGQIVLFDIGEVTERMAWDGAMVMRLRVSAHDEEAYEERIIEDEPGRVTRVQRIYHDARPESYRVVLTRRKEHAAMWQEAPSRREAWVRIRRSVPHFRIEHRRCGGSWYAAAGPEANTQYMDELVDAWPDPWRAIDGICEVTDGVMAPVGMELPADALVIPPVWVGLTRLDADDVIIGPCCEHDAPDVAPPDSQPVRIRAIREIDPPQTRGTEEANTPRTTSYAFFKRLFDIVVSAVLLLLASPVLLAVAVAIVIDDGRPVLYAHRRQRRGGATFDCWKFRTMRRNAEDLKAELARVNQCDGPQFYIRNDPRVTRVGRWLRRFHLDELPQFWNVLVGDMSIVGPRPSPDAENQFCPAWREARLSVRPGITGLWQVERTRAPGLDFQEWIRFDTEYVQRMGFWLDTRILFKTVKRVVERMR